MSGMAVMVDALCNNHKVYLPSCLRERVVIFCDHIEPGSPALQITSRQIECHLIAGQSQVYKDVPYLGNRSSYQRVMMRTGTMIHFPICNPVSTHELHHNV